MKVLSHPSPKFTYKPNMIWKDGEPKVTSAMPARTTVLLDSDVNLSLDELFSYSCPSTTVQHTIKSQPKRLAAAYMKRAWSSPQKVDQLADTLANIIHSVDSPPVSTYSHCLRGTQYGSEFAFMMADELEAFHHAHLSEPIVKTIKPANRYLISCLLSAVSLRHMFATCNTQLRAITDILELEANPYIPPAVHAVVGLGACIHILAAGRSLYDRGWIAKTVGEKRAIIRALKALRRLESTQSSNMQKVLVISIKQVEDNFPSDFDAKEVWQAIFPGTHDT